jgi:hypothetical protein
VMLRGKRLGQNLKCARSTTGEWVGDEAKENSYAQ